LYFTEADNPITNYVLEYGTKSGDYPYGVLDMGVNSRSQMTFLVKSLSPNTTYYFKIRGGNGCATGEWSNEISAKTKGFVSFNNLNIISSELTTIDNPTPTSTDTPTKEEISKTVEEIKLTEGKYDVKVKVIDVSNKPVEGATVTLHSNPQTTKTDKDGIAQFHKVEPGDHKVLIAYDNYEGEQSVNLQGDVKEFNLTVTVKTENVLLSPTAIWVIGIFVFIILTLVFFMFRRKKRR